MLWLLNDTRMVITTLTVGCASTVPLFVRVLMSVVILLNPKP